jgi:predicted nucleic acid-binding protein
VNTYPLTCVVDASVAIKLFVVEPLSAQADALFDLLVADPPGRFYVPDLFFIECANVLWKYVRRFSYPVQSARQDLRDLQALALRSEPIADLLEDALELAFAHEITAYDACYVALVRQLNVPLITADQALTRKLAALPYDIRWLGDFTPPTSPLKAPAPSVT